MPRLVKKAPKYRPHKASGQARVTINGETIYLGKWDSRDSHQEYERLIKEWRANHGTVTRKAAPAAAADITVAELLVAFWDHAQEWYRRPDGTPTTEVRNFRPIIRLLRDTYGEKPVTEFGAIALRAVRQHMIDSGWSRKNINRNVGRIRQIFNWGRGQQIIPASDAYLSLEHVEPLKAGRTKAPETEPIKPVPAAHVKAVQPYLSRQVTALVDLQLLTGMRPGEVCSMRGIDLDTTDEPWEYKPPQHKTMHHGHKRVIYLGPKAVEVVKEFLRANPQEYLFSPADAIRELREKLHRDRATPMNQGNKPKPNLENRVKKKYGNHYTTAAYDHAIAKACEKAFGMPDEIREPRTKKALEKEAKLAPEIQAKRRKQREQARSAWRAQHVWSPNQLRHNAATELRRKHGIDVAQTVLGHRLGSSITEIYAEANVEKAKDVMATIG
jgi:integrase